jgi:riboflavin synthase alpha subunit
MATEINLNGQRYTLGKLSAMQQFHVSRRIAPILPAIIRAYTQIGASEVPLPENLDLIASSIQPLADGLAALKDEDAEYVLGTCLSVVERRQDHGWSHVWSPTQKTAMFDDIGLNVMLEVAVRVIIENLGPFIQGLLTSPASSPAAT